MLSLFLKPTCNIIWCVYLFGLGVNFSNGLDEIKNVVVELWKDKTTSSLARVKTLQNAWIGFGPRGNTYNIHSLYLYIFKKNCIFKDNDKNDNPRWECTVETTWHAGRNPSTVLEFSKMYKFIVKFVIFFIAGVRTINDQINDQLLCGHF